MNGWQFRWIALALVTAGTSWAADATANGGGIPQQERRIVSAAGIAPPCVSVPLGQGVTAHLPESALTERVAARGQAGTPTLDREAFFAGNRAEMLLGSRSPMIDRHGCAWADPERMGGDEWVYLVGELIESGGSALFETGAGRFVREVSILDLNPHCQRGPLGSRSFHLAGHPSFLILITCES